jgi:hypothetical protein
MAAAPQQSGLSLATGYALDIVQLGCPQLRIARTLLSWLVLLLLM